MSLLSNYSPAEADWGIEEAIPTHRRFNSVSTNDLGPPPRLSDFGIRTHSYSNRRPSIASNDGSYHGSNSYVYYGSRVVSKEHVYENPPRTIEPSTANFHKFIKKYLSTSRNSQVTEKFKYNIIVSNLLDDTLVLSKNEQALNNLLQVRDNEDGFKPSELSKHINADGSILQVTNKRYRLTVPAFYTSPLTLLSVIYFCIFLLRQNINISSRLRHSSRMQLFKIILTVATKIQKYRRAVSAVCALQSLRSLDDFMIVNCNINKMLISNMINLKEFEMFSFLNNGSPRNDTTSASIFSKELKFHLNVLLDCLLLNTKNSIRELLPLSNGSFLEKYCSINNVPLSAILESSDGQDDKTVSFGLLTDKLTLFNNFRRFFICQLLTIHDEPLQNFFILKLCDALSIDMTNQPTFVTTAHKLAKLQKIFEDHTAMSNQLHAMNEKFRNLHNTSQTTDYANDNILSAKSVNDVGSRNEPLVPPDSELQLNNLIDTLENLTTSLRYFRKYSKSIANVADPDEEEEKVSIFNSFSAELKSASDMFSACLSEYKAAGIKSPNDRTNPSSQRNSQQAESISEQFNLKQFHTAAAKKNNQTASSKDGRHGEKRTKRTSSGLSSSLLTVMEVPGQSSNGEPRNYSQRKTNNYRNNSEEELKSEMFHQEALDALTRKNGPRASNRYSIASFNSNVSGISDLIASTHITTDDDIDNSRGFINNTIQGMPKEQLLKNLEDRFSRAYNSGNELGDMTRDGSSSDLEQEGLGDDFKSTAATDLAFLGNLERTLNLGAAK